MMEQRVTIMRGGDTHLFVYPAGDLDAMATMKFILNVAYPTGEVERRTMSADTWDMVRKRLEGSGIEIVDTRRSEAA